jgi:hypothetical protein
MGKVFTKNILSIMFILSYMLFIFILSIFSYTAVAGYAT